LPVADFKESDFAAMSLAEANKFVRRGEAGPMVAAGVSREQWVVIDQTVLEGSTCLVCEQWIEPGKGDEVWEPKREFRACRIPYGKAHGMMTNLDVVKLEFEVFVDGEAGVQADEAWKWKPLEGMDEEEISEKHIKKANALQELRDGGYAD
jgi:hypothetical protein